MSGVAEISVRGVQKIAVVSSSGYDSRQHGSLYHSRCRKYFDKSDDPALKERRNRNRHLVGHLTRGGRMLSFCTFDLLWFWPSSSAHGRGLTSLPTRCCSSVFGLPQRDVVTVTSCCFMNEEGTCRPWLCPSAHRQQDEPHTVHQVLHPKTSLHLRAWGRTHFA